jgi:hypothetical protein
MVFQASVTIVSVKGAIVAFTITAAKAGVATPAPGSFRVLGGLSAERRFFTELADKCGLWPTTASSAQRSVSIRSPLLCPIELRAREHCLV